jgi:hypothetical protein
MKKILPVLALTLFASLCSAQAPVIQWQKTFGGSGSDRAGSIDKTSDGGFIVLGASNSNDGDVTVNHGNADYWVIKLLSTGAIQWQKSLGGSNIEYFAAVKQTPDNGYIVCGSSLSVDGDITGHHGDTTHSDFWIVKLTSTGSIQWQKSFGGTNSDAAYNITLTSDGGYLAVGATLSADGDVSGHHGSYADYWAVKISSTGSMEWQKCYGGTQPDVATSVQQTADGGYIIGGYSFSIDGDVTGHHGTISTSDYWIIKISASGTLLWQKSLGGTLDETSGEIRQTFDGGYIIGGYTSSTNGDVSGPLGNSDVWVAKLSSAGTIQWKKNYGGSSWESWGLDQTPVSIQQTADSGYLLLSSTMSNDGMVTANHGSFDIWLTKITSSGTLVWQKCLGGAGRDAAGQVLQTTDGGCLVLGTTDSVSGDITTKHAGRDIWLVKLISPGTINDAINDPQDLRSVSIIPNPTTGYVYVRGVDKTTIKVYNMVGELVKEKENCDNVSLADLPSGTYLIRLIDSQGQFFVDKIIKQ